MNKIDFIVMLEVKNANPNGDPLNGNLPRQDLSNFGEISDVCIKRKIRNRFQDMGNEIFVQSNDRLVDGFTSLEKRFNEEFPVKDKATDEEIIEKSCKKWIDVRGFGQVMTFQKKAIGIRGPISIGIVKSLDPINITNMQITRSTNGMEADKKGSDTMGMKHYIDYGVYIIKGSVNSYFSEKTGFNEEDLDKLKEALKTLFINDMSSARPEGSMIVKEIFWFEHNSKLGIISTAKIHELLEFEKLGFTEDPSYEKYNIRLNEKKLDELTKKGLKVEIIEGI